MRQFSPRGPHKIRSPIYCVADPIYYFFGEVVGPVALGRNNVKSDDAERVSLQTADKPKGYSRFAECGFSRRTTSVLIMAGIDTPEGLLSMAPDRIRLIQGIGSTLMREVERYRARFR